MIALIDCDVFRQLIMGVQGGPVCGSRANFKLNR
jgi:hypothetical protein